MSARKMLRVTLPLPTPTPAPRASVTATFDRVEEKKTCWSYVRRDGDHQLLVGDFIYVRKSLFSPSEAPPTITLTIAVVE